MQTEMPNRKGKITDYTDEGYIRGLACGSRGGERPPASHSSIDDSTAYRTPSHKQE